LIVLAPDFMTNICKKAAKDFHCVVYKVFDKVKSVALWSANIRKLAKDHKGYDSAAKSKHTTVCVLLDISESK
jgi:hypothetical protein